MGGFDDNIAIIGDWAPPSIASPRGFFSGLLGDEFSSRSISEPSFENKRGGIFPLAQEQIILQQTGGKDQLTVSSSSSKPKMNPRGGLLERMAARAGFNAPRLNTESIRPADLSQNPDVRSPYLTIPPGLSPTTLLESPVFLSNSLVQPSPTTGKFPFSLGGDGRNSLSTEEPGKSKDDSIGDIGTASFAFQPVEESHPPLFPSRTSEITSINLPPQIFPGIDVFVQPGNSLPSQLMEPAKVESQNGTTFHFRDFSTKDAEHSPPPNEQQDEELDQRGGGDTSLVGGAPSEDGYNWRKYGQKQVKGSKYPRSYFKCTHTNCPVKKKVERALNGEITEIIYKGAHNHPKPTLRRLSIGSGMQLDIGDHTGAQIGADGDPRWTTYGITGGAQEWRRNNLEVTSSVSLGAEYIIAPMNGTNIESGEVLDGCSTLSSDDEEDDQRTHGSMSLGYDGEGDEYDSKRRKIEDYATEMSWATRSIREPRVVVQTTSEVDILDDGYRWRKYGQKVVKGNPNPRSYYKCTSTGCNVRKHVERASHDLKSVITTYEGKHNHNVPAARNGTHNNGPLQSASAASDSVHRPETPQLHNGMARFDRPAGLSSLGLPARQQMGLGPHNVFSLGMNQPGLVNLAMDGLAPGQCKPHVMPYLGKQRLASEMGFMFPKKEPKAEHPSEAPLNLPHGGSSVYHQIMSKFPLGP